MPGPPVHLRHTRSPLVERDSSLEALAAFVKADLAGRWFANVITAEDVERGRLAGDKMPRGDFYCRGPLGLVGGVRLRRSRRVHFDHLIDPR